MPTNVQTFITELGGGVFEEKLSLVLSDVAAAVLEHKAPGKIRIDIDIKPMGNQMQVHLAHVLSFKRPTLRGQLTEKDATVTVMHMGEQGLTLFPAHQGQLFTKRGEVVGAPNKELG